MRSADTRAPGTLFSPLTFAFTLFEGEKRTFLLLRKKGHDWRSACKVIRLFSLFILELKTLPHLTVTAKMLQNPNAKSGEHRQPALSFFNLALNLF